MLKKLKKVKNTISLYMFMAFVTMTSTIKQLTCGDGDTSFFSGSEDSSNTALSDLSTTYQHWFLVVLIVNLAFLFLTKDDKKKGIAKATTIGCILLFICSFEGPQGAIKSTFEAIAGYF